MQVTMLTKPGCVQCTMTARKLDELGIEYVAVDLTESDAALDWCRANDLLQAPVLVVGDMSSSDFDAWTGFRPDRLTTLATRMTGGAP